MSSFLTEEQENILRKASDMWGKTFQKDMAIEECSELILAISHFKRDRIHADMLLEEVADVLIICHQMQLDEDKHGIVQTIIDNKMRRLAKRVEADNPNERFKEFSCFYKP